MVSKCANPECSSPFQYFREGKLFQVETASLGELPPPGPQLVAGKKPHRMEHYWLCGPCSATMTLTYDRVKGVIAVPLRPVRRAAAS
jgi:hypothetical protein